MSVRFKSKEMGKLSKLLLNSFVFATVKAQDDQVFQVTRCNNDVSKQYEILPTAVVHGEDPKWLISSAVLGTG